MNPDTVHPHVAALRGHVSAQFLLLQALVRTHPDPNALRDWWINATTAVRCADLGTTHPDTMEALVAAFDVISATMGSPQSVAREAQSAATQLLNNLRRPDV